MTKPLALVCYENLLPGRQLVTRLEDLGYRVQTVLEAHNLATAAQAEPPMLILADLDSARTDVSAQIQTIKQSEALRHVPILAYGNPAKSERQTAATQAGAALVVPSEAILPHLEQFLDRVLEIE